MRPFAILASTIALMSSAPLAAAETPDHTFDIKTEAAKGAQAGSLSFIVSPTGRWHWNKDYPAKLTLTADGVTLPKTVLKQQDGDFGLDGNVATAKLSFTGSTPGVTEVTVTGKFGLCDDKVCIIKKVDTKAKVEVVR